jgi:hypothetical protein
MKLWMKAALSFAAMALLLWKVDLQQMFFAFAATNVKLWLAAFALFLVQQAIVTYCWQILLASNRSAPPFLKTLEVHCIGSFFGTFLPTSVAMDVIRAYHLGRHLQRGLDAAGSLFVTRVVGFLVMFFLALMAAVPLSQASHDPLLFGLVLVGLAAFAGALYLVLQKKAVTLVQALLNRFGLSSIGDRIAGFRESILTYSRARRPLAMLLAWTWLYQILGIVIIYLVGRSLGIELAIWRYFIYIPLITTIALLPVSLAGLGIREGAFVFFFAQAGVAPAQALSLSLLIFAQSVLLALIGGAWYLLAKGHDEGKGLQLDSAQTPSVVAEKSF